MGSQNILNFLEKDRPLILIHSQMAYFADTNPDGINIMLTPQFYTVKRESLPVKYTYQAKRIAPSLFEGLLEGNGKYDYFVSKEDDHWLFIAYDTENIKSFLVNKGMNLSQISKMYFAEQAISKCTGPILLGEKDALVNIEGTMTIIPQSVLQEDEKPIKIDASFTPKKGVVLEGRNTSLLQSTEAYTLASILTLFAVIYFVEGSRYANDTAAQEEEMRLLLEDYPSLQSNYTRESIASKYKTIDNQERKKRDVIKALSKMIFKGSTLTSLLVENKKFQATFSTKDENTKRKLKSLAKKEGFNSSEVANSNDLKIGGSL